MALEGLLKRIFFFFKTKLEIIKCLKKGGATDTVLSKYFEVGKSTISYLLRVWEHLGLP